jgi:hypothetical protein
MVTEGVSILSLDVENQFLNFSLIETDLPGDLCGRAWLQALPAFNFTATWVNLSESTTDLI